MVNWISRLDSIIRDKKTFLCVGLDPRIKIIEDLGFEDLFEWGRAVIDATKDLVCAYKFQLAFYELLGIEGLQQMQKTINYAKESGVILIGDAKRGDIGSTAEAYAGALFDTWGFDVVTVNPYMGFESIKPFLDRDGKGAFVVCRSSNASSFEIQELLVKGSNSEIELYQHVYHLVNKYDENKNAGLVLGATNVESIKRIRSLDDEIPLLVPGVGAQGAVIGNVLPASLSKKHNGRCVIPISRAITYPSVSNDGLVYYLDSVSENARTFVHEMENHISP